MAGPRAACATGHRRGRRAGEGVCHVTDANVRPPFEARRRAHTGRLTARGLCEGPVPAYACACATRYDLQSTAALNELKPFFFERTEQFVHELVAFCRSPFTMGVYDRYVQYGHDDATNDVVAPTPSAAAAAVSAAPSRPTASASTSEQATSASSSVPAASASSSVQAARASSSVQAASASGGTGLATPAAGSPRPAARPEPAATPVAGARSGVSVPSPTASLLDVGTAPTAAPSRTAMSGMRQRLLERIVEERRVAESARRSKPG